MAYTTPRLREALAFHGTHQQRRQCWNCHIRKQSYLHVMAKQLAGGRPKDEVVIGWGNGSTAHGSCISWKGRGPTKGLVELLRQCYARVELIDEYKANQVCSVCERAGLRTLQTADGEQPHAVRVCTHCPTVWTRDTDTAHNVFRLLKCLAAGEDPPEALRRPARRGGGRAAPELDVLQAELMPWLKPLQWRMRLRQRMDCLAVTKRSWGVRPLMTVICCIVCCNQAIVCKTCPTGISAGFVLRALQLAHLV